MSEMFNEYEMEPFDAILAEDYSLMLHEMFDDCPHDIGIQLAIMAEKVYKGEL